MIPMQISQATYRIHNPIIRKCPVCREKNPDVEPVKWYWNSTSRRVLGEEIPRGSLTSPTCGHTVDNPVKVFGIKPMDAWLEDPDNYTVKPVRNDMVRGNAHRNGYEGIKKGEV